MDIDMPINIYPHIKPPTQVALWEQLGQQGNTLGCLTSLSNEEPLTLCDISHHLPQLATPFTFPEGQTEAFPFKCLSLSSSEDSRAEGRIWKLQPLLFDCLLK